jgi:hypothetical protein
MLLISVQLLFGYLDKGRIYGTFPNKIGYFDESINTPLELEFEFYRPIFLIFFKN